MIHQQLSIIEMIAVLERLRDERVISTTPIQARKSSKPSILTREGLRLAGLSEEEISKVMELLSSSHFDSNSPTEEK